LLRPHALQQRRRRLVVAALAAGQLRLGRHQFAPERLRQHRLSQRVHATPGGDLTEEQRKPNLFYAHLYLGLYYDMVGDKKKAIEHLKQASGKYKLNYMGEVARVHREYLEKKK
jgi:hypothetical protein